MAQWPLGNVTSGSTVIAAQATMNRVNTSGVPIPTEVFHVQALQFQVLSTNTSSVYICNKQTPDLTKDILVEIPPPSAGPPATRPAWTVGNPAGANPFDATTFWILPTVIGEGVRVTVVRT